MRRQVRVDPQAIHKDAHGRKRSSIFPRTEDDGQQRGLFPKSFIFETSSVLPGEEGSPALAVLAQSIVLDLD